MTATPKSEVRGLLQVEGQPGLYKGVLSLVVFIFNPADGRGRQSSELCRLPSVYEYQGQPMLGRN